MKVPCWVCRGSGELQGEEYIDLGTVVPPIYCDWCEDGMIEVGSEKHKKYKEYGLPETNSQVERN